MSGKRTKRGRVVSVEQRRERRAFERLAAAVVARAELNHARESRQKRIVLAVFGLLCFIGAIAALLFAVFGA